MKKVIFLTKQWKEGYREAWIDKLANRTNLSPRKIREGYIQPLITDGILKEIGSRIKFHGLPNGAEMHISLR